MDGKPGEARRWYFSPISPHAPWRLSLFTVELTQQCNFRCSYCCFSGLYHDRRKHNALVMSEATMHDTVRFILANRCPDRLTLVTFYGGEALLALDRMKTMVSTLRGKLGADVGFSISTNGYALTPEVVDWIAGLPDCHVYVTLDGHREWHDLNRRTRGGLPTYDRILANLKHFKANYPAEYQERVGFLVTLRHWHQLIDVSDRWMADPFLSGKLPKHVSFILPRTLEEMLHPASPPDERRRVLDVAFQRYRSGEKSMLTQQFVELTDQMHRTMQTLGPGNGIPKNEIEIRVSTCLEDLYRTFISTEGNVYICERFGSGHAIGHVREGRLDRLRLEGMEQAFIDRRNRRCTQCEAAVLCRICLTAANYTDTELDALCHTERATVKLLQEFAWQRRMFDRSQQLLQPTLIPQPPSEGGA